MSSKLSLDLEFKVWIERPSRWNFENWKDYQPDDNDVYSGNWNFGTQSGELDFSITKRTAIGEYITGFEKFEEEIELLVMELHENHSINLISLNFLPGNYDMPEIQKEIFGKKLLHFSELYGYNINISYN